MKAATTHDYYLVIQRSVWLVGFVLLTCLLYGLLEDELLAAATCGVMSVLALLAWSVRQRALLVTLPALAFVLGNVLCLGVFNYLYVNFTTFLKGSYHELTAWLTALMGWAAAFGCIGADAVLRKPRQQDPAASSEFIRSPELLWVTGACFFSVLGMEFALGLLNARYDPDTWRRGPSGLIYTLHGITNATYIFFVALGAQIRDRFAAPRNWAILALVAACLVATGLTGGREMGIRMLVLMAAGAAAAGMSPWRLAVLGSASVVVGSVFFMVVGAIRGDELFAGGSIDDKITAVRAASEGEQGIGAVGDRSGFEATVLRVFEGFAQVVIDDTEFTGRRAGFENFDRLAYLFIPNALAPDKRPLNDGPEILARDYGATIDDSTSVPITLVADAHRRGGAPWVFVVGLLSGIVWRLSVQAITLAMPDMALPTVLLLTVVALRTYSASALGVFDVMIYRTGKVAVLVGALAAVARLLAYLRANMRPADARGGPRLPTR